MVGRHRHGGDRAHAFHTAFKSFSIGYGSAIAVVMLALNFAFAILYLRWSRARA